jgi:DNA invertase Pin-like site-specific DNA recombinase
MEKHFDVVLFDDISRLSRNNPQQLCNILITLFKDIPVMSVEDNLGISQRDSELCSQIKAIIHDAYMDDLNMKTLQGNIV